MLRFECLDQGTKARILRIAAGLTQQKLAASVGVDRRRLSEYERGQLSLAPEAIARVYAVLADWDTPATACDEGPAGHRAAQTEVAGRADKAATHGSA